MTPTIRFAAAIALVTLTAAHAAAADLPMSLQTAAACAPRASAVPVPVDALRLLGAQDVVARELFDSSDLVIIGGGTTRGIQLGHQFFVRKLVPVYQPARVRAITTVGSVRVVAVNETTAIASVVFACDGMAKGDHLEPYVTITLPPDADRPDTSGEPDFSAPSRVLFGENERTTGAVGDFMLAEVGQDQGAVAGTRFAIYRDVGIAGLPLAAVGEAIVISADADTSVVRLTLTRDAIRSGDLLFPRRR